MPYDFVENHPKCKEGEVGLEQSETGEFLGCHPSRQSAQQQVAAIESNKMKFPDSLLITPTFGELKDLNDKGLFGGKLIIFGSTEKHDFERDFFTKDTEFWLNEGKGSSAVLWDHGKDSHLGKSRLDDGGAEIAVKEDTGVFLRTQLRRRNKYEEAVQELAKRGKLGLSSGTASHLVEREVAGTNEQGEKVTHIKQWPLGLDASLTPEPAEPRTKIHPVSETSGKSIKNYLEENGVSTEPEKRNTQVLGADIVEETLKSFETKATDEEIEERYEEFQSTVNMSASEVERWGEKECSDKASQNPEKVRNRVINLLRTNKSEWGDSEFRDAGKVISFINRMKEVDGGDKPSQDCPTKKVISLRNWAFDPNKSTTVDGILKDIDEIASNFKATHEYSMGDLVSWEDGTAQGRIEELVGPEDEVSPSTTERTFSGNEDDPGYLIELVDKNEDGEIVGRDETVFHLESTLTKISEEDVKSITEKLTKSLENVNKKFEDRDGSSDNEPKGMATLEDKLDSLIEQTQ